MESMRGYPVCETIPLSCASVHALWTCIFVVHGSPVANSNSCTAVSFFVSSCRTLRTYSIPVFASSAFVRENQIRSVSFFVVALDNICASRSGGYLFRKGYAAFISSCSQYLEVASTSEHPGHVGLSLFGHLHVLARKQFWFGRHLSTLPVFHRLYPVRRSTRCGLAFLFRSHHGALLEIIPLVRRRLRRRISECGGGSRIARNWQRRLSTASWSCGR